MASKGHYLKPQPTCNHCAGVMREYLGLVTCMMCGRIEEHHCPNCVAAKRPEHEQMVTAKSA
jgi:hypothetical protein